MPKVTFVGPDGRETTLDAGGESLMEIATAQGIEGIDGACGGVCSCATCHVRVDPAWTGRVGSPGETERDILDFETGTDERSRLCCQIEMTDELDGLVVEVAPLH